MKKRVKEKHSQGNELDAIDSKSTETFTNLAAVVTCQSLKISM